MYTPEQRIAELHYELGMLQTALEFMQNPADRDRVLTRLTACIAEYTQLIDARLSAVDGPPSEGGRLPSLSKMKAPDHAAGRVRL